MFSLILFIKGKFERVNISKVGPNFVSSPSFFKESFEKPFRQKSSSLKPTTCTQNSVMCGSCHIRNVRIGVKYQNCRQILDVYLLFSIWMGQIQSKLIYMHAFLFYKKRSYKKRLIKFFNHKKQRPIEFLIIRNDFSKKWITLLWKCFVFFKKMQKGWWFNQNQFKFYNSNVLIKKTFKFFL